MFVATQSVGFHSISWLLNVVNASRQLFETDHGYPIVEYNPAFTYSGNQSLIIRRPLVYSLPLFHLSFHTIHYDPFVVLCAIEIRMTIG
jgi:hypothetical protein